MSLMTDICRNLYPKIIKLEFLPERFPKNSKFLSFKKEMFGKSKQYSSSTIASEKLPKMQIINFKLPKKENSNGQLTKSL